MYQQFKNISKLQDLKTSTAAYMNQLLHNISNVNCMSSLPLAQYFKSISVLFTTRSSAINIPILTVWSSFEIVLGFINKCEIIRDFIMQYSETN